MPDDVQPGRRDATASLRLADGPLAGAVLRRVVSMVLTRAECPVDRLDDAMLICETISAHAPAHARDGHVDFALSARPEGFELRVAGLRAQGASRLVRDAEMPGLGNVLERTTDGLRVEPSAGGGHDELVLALVF